MIWHKLRDWVVRHFWFFPAANHLDYLGVDVAWITGPWFLSIFVNMLPWESGQVLNYVKPFLMCYLAEAIIFLLFASFPLLFHDMLWSVWLYESMSINKIYKILYLLQFFVFGMFFSLKETVWCYFAQLLLWWSYTVPVLEYFYCLIHDYQMYTVIIFFFSFWCFYPPLLLFLSLWYFYFLVFILFHKLFDFYILISAIELI